MQYAQAVLVHREADLPMVAATASQKTSFRRGVAGVEKLLCELGSNLSNNSGDRSSSFVTFGASSLRI